MCHTTDTWKKRLERRILQEPLIETRPSLEALHQSTRRLPPRAIMLGIGLCSRTRMSAALPVDVLGMLLPAEHIRRVVGARSLVVLIADEHAISNRFDPALVRRRANALVETFTQMRHALGLRHLTVVRASSFHHTYRYRALLQEIERRSPGIEHAYIKKQVADTEYLDRACQGILKVGWTIGAANAPGPAQNGARARCDETFFDARVRACFGNHVGFVYCKAGRALDDEKQKAIPYVALEPASRICLQPDESVFHKLERAQGTIDPATVNSYRNYLRALAYSYARHIAPLSGALEHRVQTIIARIAAAPRCTSTFATARRAGAHVASRRASAPAAHVHDPAATSQAAGS